MALIKCPECGREISDQAESCPGCGYVINKKNSRNSGSKKNVILAMIATAVVITIVFAVGSRVGNRSYRRSSSSHTYSSGKSYSYGSADSAKSNYSYSSSSTAKNDDSAIFKNLDIKDFSCKKSTHSGRMQCTVTNNNSYTVTGYFYVNFYDASGSLLYSHLMPLPDVASGENVACSTLIPKDDYPDDYSKVGFSQAALTSVD